MKSGTRLGNDIPSSSLAESSTGISAGFLVGLSAGLSVGLRGGLLVGLLGNEFSVVLPALQSSQKDFFYSLMSQFW